MEWFGQSFGATDQRKSGGIQFLELGILEACNPTPVFHLFKAVGVAICLMEQVDGHKRSRCHGKLTPASDPFDLVEYDEVPAVIQRLVNFPEQGDVLFFRKAMYDVKQERAILIGWQFICEEITGTEKDPRRHAFLNNAFICILFYGFQVEYVCA